MPDETAPSGGVPITGEPIFTEHMRRFLTADNAFTVRLWLTGTITRNEADFLAGVARSAIADAECQNVLDAHDTIGESLRDAGVLKAVEVTDELGNGEVFYYRWT